MFRDIRLRKEDYELMGELPTWRVEDACHLFASFEMETSKAFELVDDLSLLEKQFKGLKDEWYDYIVETIFNLNLKYHNDQDTIYEPMGDETLEISNYVGLDTIFYQSDFLDHMYPGNSSVDFDFRLFCEFLQGSSSAPSRATEIISEAMRQSAKRRHVPEKPKKEGLEKFLLEDLSGGCTCTKVQACERIFRDKYESNKDRLKKETGYGYLMFTRKVSDALVKIEEIEKTGINRHENTPGFSTAKVPTCQKHPQK